MAFMFVTLLVILGVLSRLLPHISQFTAILAVAMFGGMYLPRRQAMILPVAIMIISDVFLGFHNTMFWTWGGMMLASAIGIYLRQHKNGVSVIVGSFIASFVFFIVTNFGAWLTLYPLNTAGFVECYTLAIPFFRSTLLSTVVYSVILFYGYEFLCRRGYIPVWARS